MVRRVIDTLSLIHRVFNHPNIWKRDDFLCVSDLHMPFNMGKLRNLHHVCNEILERGFFLAIVQGKPMQI